MDIIYSKILVSQYSINNKCYVQDGIPLYVKPLNKIPLKDYISHNFTSLEDFKTKSKYGWVKQISCFSFDDFIKKYFSKKSLTENELNTIIILLDSINNLENNIPVATDYSLRGIENRRMDLTVHKVIFYNK